VWLFENSYQKLMCKYDNLSYIIIWKVKCFQKKNCFVVNLIHQMWRLLTYFAEYLLFLMVIWDTVTWQMLHKSQITRLAYIVWLIYALACPGTPYSRAPLDAGLPGSPDSPTLGKIMGKFCIFPPIFFSPIFQNKIGKF